MQTHQTTRAPFFKPLSPPSLTAVASDSQQERLVVQDKQRASNQVTRNKDLSWDTIQSASLHARLQQEAEKIRRWKLSTELDLKQRERKIVECQATIDQQRKAILDLQLETEDLTVRLQNEVSNQQEVQHKIDATRDMCRALKDHSAKVDENVQQGESDRLELKAQQQVQTDKVQDLTSKFHQLELQCSVEHEDMVKRHKQDEEERVQLTSAKEHSESELKSLKRERDALQTAATQSSEKVVLLTEQLEEMVKAKENLENEEVAIREKLRHAESLSESQGVQVESLGGRLQASQDTIKDLNERVHSLQCAMASLDDDRKNQIEECKAEAKQFSEQLDAVKNELEAVKDELAKEEKRSLLLLGDLEVEQQKYEEVQNVKGKLEENNSSVNIALSQVNEKKESLETELHHFKSEKLALEQKITGMEDMLLQSKEDHRETQLHLDAAHQDIDALKSDGATLKEEKQCLQEEVAVQKEALAAMQKDVESTRLDQQEIGDQLQKAEEELKSSKSNEAKLQAEMEFLKECKEGLEKEKQCISTALDIAKAQLQGYMEADSQQKKEISGLEGANTQLREEIDQAQQYASSASGKAGEALEKKQQQIKALKKDLADEVKKGRTGDKQIRTLESRMLDLEKNMVEKDAMLEEVAEALQVKTDIVNVLNNKITQLEELQGKAEAAVESEREAQMQYELKSQELCATLEKYKMENQKIVERKDKEVEELRAQLQQMEQGRQEQQAANQKSEERKEEEIKELRSQLQLVEKELQEHHENGKLTVQTTASKPTELEMDTSPPFASLPFKNLPRTPRAQSSKCTTSATCQTPLASKSAGKGSVSTPGILRTGPPTQPCKRKVIFAGDQASSGPPEHAHAAIPVHCKTPTTPALGRSPRSSAGASTPRSNVRHAPTTPVRQSPAAKQSRTSATKPAVQDEMQQFAELFPEKSTPAPTSREKKRSSSIQSSRSMKKLKIKSSDGASKKPKPDETNWFDTDTVFGFRPEE